MLYLVSVSGISAGEQLDYYEDFIVEAENEENLATAIVADRLDGMESGELDGSVWRVRELGDEFELSIKLDFICKGERL